MMRRECPGFITSEHLSAQPEFGCAASRPPASASLCFAAARVIPGRRYGETEAVPPVGKAAGRLSQDLAKSLKMARVTGLEPATSGVTGRHSNRLSYTRAATDTSSVSIDARWIRG